MQTMHTSVLNLADDVSSFFDRCDISLKALIQFLLLLELRLEVVILRFPPVNFDRCLFKLAFCSFVRSEFKKFFSVLSFF